MITNGTCVKFRQATPRDKYYAYVQWDVPSCGSNVGMMSIEHQPQIMYLSRSGCFVPGLIAHELLHAIGLDHQHNTMKRDDYVKIHWDNVKDGLDHLKIYKRIKC